MERLNVWILRIAAFFILGYVPSVFAAGERPYVLMVSIDGYRSDYTDRYKPPFLSQFVQKDCSCARAMLPVFPSKTYTNHWSLMTGMYPAKHGIVAMEFLDQSKGRRYSFKPPESQNGEWYKGVPIWTAARRGGIKTASLFWPGDAVKEEAQRPDYFLPYRHDTSLDDRVKHVVEWLKLPAAERPRFISVYFSQVDDAGHAFGPDSSEVRDAVHGVDHALARMVEQVRALNLPVNVVIVGDHGMEDANKAIGVVVGNHLPQDSRISVIGDGPFVSIYTGSNELTDKVMQAFSAVPHLSAYRKGKFPVHFHLGESDLLGDVLLVVKPPYFLLPYKWSTQATRGVHGYDPSAVANMKTVFYAKGPQLKPAVVPEFENIHVYPLVLKILGLNPDTSVDGRLEVLASLLRP